MRRTGSFFQSFLPFIFNIAIQIIVIIGVMVFLGARTMVSGNLDTGIIPYLDGLATDTQFNQLVSMIAGIIIIIIFSIWYQRVFVHPLKNKTRRYWSGISVQVIISLIFLAFGMQYIAQLIAGTVGHISPELMANYTELMNSAGYDEFGGMLAIYSLILAPIAEELTFRGLTLRFARQALPFWAANIFQAVLFGVLHLNVVQGIYAFALGLFLGWVCNRGHSLKYGIILHIIFNVLGTIFIDFFDLTLGLNEYVFYAVGIGLTIFAMAIFHFEFSDRNRRRKEKQEDFE